MSTSPMWTPRARYAEYMRSSAWHIKRNTIMRRAAGICEFDPGDYVHDDEWTAMGRPFPPTVRCTEPAVHCHHLSYERLGHEAPDDLLAVCDFHHKVLHVHDRLCDVCGDLIFSEIDDVIGYVASFPADESLESIYGYMGELCDYHRDWFDDD